VEHLLDRTVRGDGKPQAGASRYGGITDRDGAGWHPPSALATSRCGTQSTSTTLAASAAGDSSSSERLHSTFCRLTLGRVMRAMVKRLVASAKRPTAARGCKV